MNTYLWSIAVNCLAAGLTFDVTKAYILTQVAGDADAIADASTQLDDAETELETQAGLPVDDRASWYIPTAPSIPGPVGINAVGDTVALSTAVNGLVDGSGLGDGGRIRLKSPDGTIYDANIADGGAAWDINAV